MMKRPQSKLRKRSVLNKGEESSSKMLDSPEVSELENEGPDNEQSAKELCPPSNDKRRLKKINAQRSEASENISEFDLNEVGKETVKLNELIKTSQKLCSAGSVKKQLEKVKKLQSLSVPLSKPQMTKIKRNMGYTKICEELERWEPIVRNNRAAEKVVFPLKKPEVHLESFEQATEKYVLKHPVAIAVDELLQKSEHVLEKDKLLTEAEEKALKAMSPEEAKERHAKLMKHRALISYQEAKARRQNKIKSKRYHRLLKKEKMKKLMKEFEELEKTDASKALEKLVEADQLRILERMTLKHRNTGKWARMQKLRAKYNPEARDQLKEDLLIGRKLKEKVGSKCSESSDLVPLVELSEDTSTQNYDDIEIPSAEKGVEADTLVNKLCVSRHIKNAKMKKKSVNNDEDKEDITEIDEGFFIKASTLDSCNPSDICNEEALDEIENSDDDSKKSNGADISEVLADKEIIEEFKDDKRNAEEANRPKGVDLFLPGWGSWAGAGIKISEKKRKRFYIPPPEEPAPKKSTLGNVIINEDRDKKAGVHKVSSLPFPFSNIHQFESYIRQPVGHTWNPPSSFRSLTEPRVVTKVGKVIEPLDPDDVVLERTKKKEPQQKKRVKNAREIKAF